MKKLLNKLLHALGLHSEEEIQLSNNAISTLVIQLSSAALVLLANATLTRLLGKNEYGTYAFAMSITLVACGIVGAGVYNLVVREFAAAFQDKNYAHAKGIFNWAGFRVLLLAGIITIAGCLFTRFTKSPGEQTSFYIAFLIVPFLSLLHFFQATLQGGFAIRSSQLPDKIVRPIGLILLLLLAQQLYLNTLTANNALLIHGLIIILAMVAGGILFAKQLPHIFKSTSDLSKRKSWNHYYKTFFFLGVLSIVNSKLDVLMIGFINGDDEVGVYNISARVAEIIAFSLAVANFGLAPMISKLYQNKEFEKLQTVVTKSARFALIIALPAFLLLVLAGRFFLGLFGEGFEDGYTSLILLSISQLINVLAGSCGYLLSMTGNEKSATLSMIIGLAINAGLNFLLVPKFGINGAAFATAIAIIVWNILMASFVKVKLNINPTFIGK